jgi:hypothetical protein
MGNRFTLRLDEELIERVKSYARESGKSVSQLISDYLELLTEQEHRQSRPLTPIVESLRGSLAGAGQGDYTKFQADLLKDEGVEDLSRKAMLLRRAKAKEAAG